VVKGAVVTFIDMTERRRARSSSGTFLRPWTKVFLPSTATTPSCLRTALSRMMGAPLMQWWAGSATRSCTGCRSLQRRRGRVLGPRGIRDGRPCMLVHTHRRPGLQDIQVEIKCYPAGCCGRVATVIMTIVDITEKRKLEDQLQQRRR